jgi:hypothetical protein
MLPGSQTLSKLLSSIYDAATDPAMWDSVLEQITLCSHAQSAALMLQNSKQNVHTVARHWEVDPEAVRLYNQHYGALDVWAGKAASIAAPQWVGTSESLCSFGELSRTEYYNDFLEHLGLPYAMFSLCQPTGHPDFVLGVYRGLHHGEFHSSELDLLHFLTPHIRRAFNLHLLISDLKDRSARITTAFDMLPTAIILLGHKVKSCLRIAAPPQSSRAKMVCWQSGIGFKPTAPANQRSSKSS